MKPENRALSVIILVLVVGVGVGEGSVLYVSSGHPPGAVLRVTASTERSVYAVNDTVNVAVAITNEGSKALNLSWSCQGDGIRVTNVAGQVVFDSRAGLCPLVIVVGTLPPGETRTFEYPWTADVPPLARYYIQPEVAGAALGESVGTSIWVV